MELEIEIHKAIAYFGFRQVFWRWTVKWQLQQFSHIWTTL